jgi:hypothetical protein
VVAPPRLTASSHSRHASTVLSPRIKRKKRTHLAVPVLTIAPRILLGDEGFGVVLPPGDDGVEGLQESRLQVSSCVRSICS